MQVILVRGEGEGLLTVKDLIAALFCFSLDAAVILRGAVDSDFEIADITGGLDTEGEDIIGISIQPMLT